MRIIEVIADEGHIDTLRGIAEHHEILDFWVVHSEPGERSSVRLLVRPAKQQTIVDVIQKALASDEDSRIVILPVEATLPRPDEEGEKRSAVMRTREELYQNIEGGCRLDNNYLLMVILSTVVATIGLIEDNVAVVIGAMVIAPLLGPNIALAFASSLGESRLFWAALRTNIAGLALAFGLSFLIGWLWKLNLTSGELMDRTHVGYAGMTLALASGAAGVLSLTSGLSSALVGVMVAVAILPPTATIGLMLAGQQYDFALGAAMLLAVNIVCVNLAAKLVFLTRGIKPRTWLEKQKARQSVVLYTLFWLVLLVLLIVLMAVQPPGTMQ
ncbi:MAG TPA: TIGR00341 family protein [Gammaproteobacteria bacterium]|nr:TIGR00341 family protein [Gammaproteobacteria bacterium]